ncbi:hypothetical protein Pfo_027304 [Paulownia fortunei]|nr:hypothetical protein Pfo_027304 [Paulownia fortunei]
MQMLNLEYIVVRHGDEEFKEFEAGVEWSLDVAPNATVLVSSEAHAPNAAALVAMDDGEEFRMQLLANAQATVTRIASTVRRRMSIQLKTMQTVLIIFQSLLQLYKEGCFWEIAEIFMVLSSGCDNLVTFIITFMEFFVYLALHLKINCFRMVIGTNIYKEIGWLKVIEIDNKLNVLSFPKKEKWSLKENGHKKKGGVAGGGKKILGVTNRWYKSLGFFEQGTSKFWLTNKLIWVREIDKKLNVLRFLEQRTSKFRLTNKLIWVIEIDKKLNVIETDEKFNVLRWRR